MSPEAATHLIAEALLCAFWVSLPLLAICFVVGTVVNVLQIVTSLQDTAFSSVPRLVALLGGVLLLMPWMLGRMMDYVTRLFADFARYAR